MSDAPDVDEVFAAALDLLEREGVPCVVMGGLAVAMWGVPRATFDVDLAVQLDRDRLPALLDAAVAAGFDVDVAHRRGFVEEIGGLPLVPIKRWAGTRAVAVDLFLAETPFQTELFRRGVTITVHGRARRIVTAADLVLLKLLAWRRKDRLDIENVLAVQGIPDEAHLRAWAGRLGVLDRLETVLTGFGAQDRGGPPHGRGGPPHEPGPPGGQG